MKNIIVDIHCHPTIKPYGKSFPEKIHSEDSGDRNSLYFYDPPNLLEKILNKFLSLTKFSQSNICALTYGEVNIIIASLYPLEKGFVRTEYGSGPIMDDLLDLAVGVGHDRINFLQDLNNGYYNDVHEEYKFLAAVDGKILTIDRQDIRYKIVDSYSQILADQLQTKDNEGLYSVYIFLSIEGCHVLFDNFSDIGKSSQDAKNSVFANIDRLKGIGSEAWEHSPFFITFAHHFYNGLCGHARSLQDFFVKLVTNQDAHIDETINEFGEEVILRLLSKQGKRILIDIKHMSLASRLKYFDLLKNHPQLKDEGIPVIMSHGAVTGNESNFPLFLNEDINISDKEILAIGQSKGLFGIQLDERRIASKAEIQNFRRYNSRRKVLYHGTLLVWRQIQHIAEVLDNDMQYAWGIQCLGTDFDGIINPLDGIWTAENFSQLEDYLLMHAHNYVESKAFKQLKNAYNQTISAEEIVSRFMGNNASSFLQIHRK